VGCKFLDPNYKQDGSVKPVVEKLGDSEQEKENKSHNRAGPGSIRLSENAVRKPKKKKCC